MSDKKRLLSLLDRGTEGQNLSTIVFQCMPQSKMFRKLKSTKAQLRSAEDCGLLTLYLISLLPFSERFGMLLQVRLWSRTSKYE